MESNILDDWLEEMEAKEKLEWYDEFIVLCLLIMLLPLTLILVFIDWYKYEKIDNGK